MTAVAIELLPVVTYAREGEAVKLLPVGYSLDRLTVVRADQVRAGDLVVGSADQPLKRGSSLRWATYLYAAFVAQPGSFEADCPSCRAWTFGAEGPWVNLTPHNPERADALISIIPADEPVGSSTPACVNACTCEKGFLRQETRSFYPPAVCGTCHRRPCGACAEASTSTH
jgi:hypothetical protein